VINHILLFPEVPNSAVDWTGLERPGVVSEKGFLGSGFLRGRESSQSSMPYPKTKKTSRDLSWDALLSLPFPEKLHDQSPTYSQRRSGGTEASTPQKREFMKPISFAVGSWVSTASVMGITPLFSAGFQRTSPVKRRRQTFQKDLLKPKV
jgi:hypothetical protein